MFDWLYNVVVSFLSWFLSLVGVSFPKKSTEGGNQQELSQYSSSPSAPPALSEELPQNQS